jgi:hypothetical protein
MPINPFITSAVTGGFAVLNPSSPDGTPWFEVDALTGAVTAGAGEVATGASTFSTVPIGSVAYSAFGNATTTVSGTIYWAEVFIPRNFVATGIAVLNGGTVGTNNGIVALYSTTGALLANSALAGAVTAGANAFQTRNFTATYSTKGPARYFVAYQANGAVDNIRTIAASTFVTSLTSSATGTFGTLTALTVPTTVTANVGPIAYVY